MSENPLHDRVLVEIENVPTGEVRVYEAGAWYEHSDFLWSEGNYACDCNRGDFFDYAGGGSGDPDRGCGTQDFRIVSIKSPSGETLYSEEGNTDG